MAARVCTFNVRFDSPGDGEDRWELRRASVAAVLRESGADVVGLQEVLRSQRDDIAAALPEFACIATGRDGGDQGEMNPLLFRTAAFAVCAARCRKTHWMPMRRAA